MAAQYLLKRRSVGTYPNPYRRGGYGVGYGRWITVARADTYADALASRREGLYDWAVFLRGKRVHQ